MTTRLQFDTFEKDIIIIPVNHSNMHWCCSAVNIKEKRFEYYDSLGRPRDFVYQVRCSPCPMSCLYRLRARSTKRQRTTVQRDEEDMVAR